MTESTAEPTTKWVPIDVATAQLAVSTSTLRGWVRNKVIPSTCYIKMPSGYRFSVEAIFDHFRSLTPVTTK